MQTGLSSGLFLCPHNGEGEVPLTAPPLSPLVRGAQELNMMRSRRPPATPTGLLSDSLSVRDTSRRVSRRDYGRGNGNPYSWLGISVAWIL